MKRFFSWIGTILLIAAVGGTTLVVSNPVGVSAKCVNQSFLGIPSWSNGLTTEVNGDCVVMSPDNYASENNIDKDQALQAFVWRIVLNSVNIAISSVAYISVGFILYGGLILIKGMTGVSPGSPEIAATARKTILNACIGLVISISAVSIVGFISQIYTGSTTGALFEIPLVEPDNFVVSVLNMFYFVIGIVAVVIIIISGYMFAVAGSEPSTLARAKNMIYYAVIGLGIDFFAFAITHFIIGRIG